MSSNILTNDETTTVVPELNPTTAGWSTSSNEILLPSTITEEFPTSENVNFTNTLAVGNQTLSSESQVTSSVFQAFIIIEIIMTALELTLSILAASRVSRWRRNYRNQMLMQISLVRFLKRIYNLISFLHDEHTIPKSSQLDGVLLTFEIYIDFVIVILVCFFINHMYNSLILVLIKTSKNQLLKVIMCSWLIPVPISVVGLVLVLNGILTDSWMYLIICAVFRWPLMLIGSVIYFTILLRVLFDKIRRFARSLTIITFLLCLVINLHLFLKDIIQLWCYDLLLPILVSYLLGFVMNVLILCLYITLIALHLKCQSNLKSCDSMPNCSEPVTKC